MKIGFIVPYQEIADVARPILAEKKLDVVYFSVAPMHDTVNEARKAIEAGAEVIISRGYQAHLIKETTKIPVIEIRIHSQEIGLQIVRAKQIVNHKERIHIGLLASKNALADMSSMEELFNVNLTVAEYQIMEEIPELVSDLVDRGVDIFIGGERCAEAAQILGYPALIYKSSKEAIYEAIRESEHIAYATEVEKQNQAQLSAMLDNSFNGIIRLNSKGQIIVINRLVENLIDRKMADVIGEPVERVIPEIDYGIVENILNGEYDNYTVTINLKKQPWILMFAPIQYNDEITGAVLSLQKIKDKTVRREDIVKDMFLQGYVADHVFTDLHTSDPVVKAQIEKAKKFALSNRPVVIYCEDGAEHFYFAESIHNNSARKDGPFISINLNSLNDEEQMEMLFGAGGEHERKIGAMEKATYGTLFINGIEYASRKVQHYISKHLFPRTITKTDIDTVNVYDVRLIMASRKKLPSLVTRGDFSSELFYQIQGMTIDIPPLRYRKDDLLYFFNDIFKSKCEKYQKYLILTQGAQQRLCELPWNGNYVQIQTFCETLVLLSDRRSVDEVAIQKLYDELFPKISVMNEKEHLISYSSPEEEEILMLLQKYHGNRKLIAEELGISSTTLWRKMKKYNIGV
ncbi:MAG: PrpR N-terminal domain-containing protein [Clostridia bacterium]|nr:PrpR N-terminal domain-containing protein [Clostridia bacterium]